MQAKEHHAKTPVKCASGSCKKKAPVAVRAHSVKANAPVVTISGKIAKAADIAPSTMVATTAENVKANQPVITTAGEVKASEPVTASIPKKEEDAYDYLAEVLESMPVSATGLRKGMGFGTVAGDKKNPFIKYLRKHHTRKGYHRERMHGHGLLGGAAPTYGSDGEDGEEDEQGDEDVNGYSSSSAGSESSEDDVPLLSGRGLDRAARKYKGNPWLSHLASVRAENPDLPLKSQMVLAGQTYRWQS